MALKEQDEERPRHNSESNEQLDTLKDEVKRLAEALLTAKRHVDKLNQKIHDVEENHKQEVEKIKLGGENQTFNKNIKAIKKIMIKRTFLTNFSTLTCAPCFINRPSQ